VAAITPDEIIQILNLKPLPVEGGYYAETYRSFPMPSISGDAGLESTSRPLSTAIYYLLTPDTFSALHRLPGDEIYHFYTGDPVELLILDQDGSTHTRILGTDFASGMRPQVIAPGGAWQGSALCPGGSVALLGTTMTPGYHHVDFELGFRADLIRQFPTAAGHIRRLTR